MKSVSVIGCGFVLHYYMLTLSKSKTLRVAGVFDLLPERAAEAARHYGIPKAYASLAELLGDESVEIVVNLTGPRSHYETTLACLEAGKHVYSEKPLAMSIDDARRLAELAEARGLRISCAPCSMLGEAAQTVWKVVRERRLGDVRLAYAEMDEDLIHKLHLENLKTPLGVPWPAQDEYEVGVTLEHAGYYLAWLAAIFGPAKSMTAFASCLIPDKMPGVTLDPPDTPDFTVACIEFESGAVARLTCGIVAEHDHSLTLFGEKGILHLEEAWDYGSSIRIQWRTWIKDTLKSPAGQLATRGWRKLCRHFPIFKVFNRLEHPLGFTHPLVRPRPDFSWVKGLVMDFSRGIQELAEAIDEKRESRLSTRFSLHITEMALAMQNARHLPQPYRMTTTFAPVTPMPWAQ